MGVLVKIFSPKTQNQNSKLSNFIFHCASKLQEPALCLQSTSSPSALRSLASCPSSMRSPRSASYEFPPSLTLGQQKGLLCFNSIYLKCVSHLLILFGFVLMVVWSLGSLLICPFFFLSMSHHLIECF